MKRLTIPVFLCLISGLALGDTFELSDPASEIYEELEKEKQAAREEAVAPRPAEPPAAPQPQPVRSTSEPLPAGGVGTTPCPEIVGYKQDAPKWYEVRLSWALGYVNAATDSTAAPQPEALDSWLDFYCRENPDANLARAADAFVQFRGSGG